MGIEPTLSAWEAEVLPLNYTRKKSLFYRRTVCYASIVDSTNNGLYSHQLMKKAARQKRPSRLSGPRQNTFKCVGEKNAGTNQAHRRCEHLEHCNRPCAPPRMHTKRRRCLHSQKHFAARPHNAPAVGLWSNRCVKSGQARVAIVAEKQRLGNHRKALPISAVIRLRYLQTLLRRWAVATRKWPVKLPLT